MSATEIVRLTVEAVHDALDGRELTKRALGSALRPHMPTALQPWFDDQTFSEFTAVLTRAASLTGDLCVTPRRGNEATFALTDQWLGHVRPEADPAVQRLELLRRFLRCSHRRRSMTSPPGPASR
jgi:hypothetical protein